MRKGPQPRDPTELTERQRQVVAAVDSHIREKGAPPSMLELARALGIKSANAAEMHVLAIAKKGALELAPGRTRIVRVVGQTITPPAEKGEALP